MSLRTNIIRMRQQTKVDKPWLCFTAEQANSTVQLNKIGTPNAVTLEISRDGKVWTPYSWTDKTGDTITLIKVGDKVYWRNVTIDDSGTLSKSTDNYYIFNISGQISGRGNIQSLIKVDGRRSDVPSYCFNQLFKDCTSLISAPELPAMTLNSICYFQMFRGCTSLVSAPELPAMTLGNYCYSQMFMGCTSLISAPKLPAVTLANSCYNQMFQGCNSLVSVPELPATTLANSCYSQMFRACYLINAIKTSHTDWRESVNATTNWLYLVANSGTFYCSDELDDSIRDASHIPAGWTVIKQGYFHDGVLYQDASFTTPSNISSTTAIYEDILTGNRYSSDGTSLTLITS